MGKAPFPTGVVVDLREVQTAKTGVSHTVAAAEDGGWGAAFAG